MEGVRREKGGISGFPSNSRAEAEGISPDSGGDDGPCRHSEPD